MTRTLLFLLAALPLALFPAAVGSAGSGEVSDAHSGWWMVGGDPDGNPLAPGSGDLSRPGVVRDRFKQAPRWMVSGELAGGGADELAILFADGTLEVQGMENGRFRRLASWSGISPEAPPVLAPGGVKGEPGPGLLCVDDRGRMALYTVEGGPGKTLLSGVSPLTFPVLAHPAGDGEAVLFAVGDDGSLMALAGEGQPVVNRDTPLLPDARLVIADLNGDRRGEIVALSRPLEKLKSTRLGDDTEAQGLAVFSWDGQDLRLDSEYRLEGKRHFEALRPVVGELDRGGKRSLVLPVVEEGGGSSIWTFSWSSRTLRKEGEGPATKDRKAAWQVLAVTPLGDHDRTLVLAVNGPEEGAGTLQALRGDLAATPIGTFDGIVARVPGSRSVDLALVGDLAGTGKRVLLAPGKDGSSLRLFTFKGNALNSSEVFPGSKAVSSNLCPGDFDGDGKTDAAFGAQDGTLVVLTGR